MARLGINTGSTINDGTGDSLRVAGGKINDNFSEIYTYFGDGSDLNYVAPSGYWIQTSVGIHTLSNVGLGTTNPTSRLTVTGDVNISGVLTAANFVSSSGSGQGFSVYSGITTTVNLGGYFADAGYRSYIQDLYIGDMLKDAGGSWNLANTGNLILNGSMTAASSIIASSIIIESSGISAPAGIITASSFSGSSASISGDTSTSQLNVVGISTLGAGVTVTGTTFTNQLNVSGISTFNQIKVTGVSTFSNNVQIDSNKTLIFGNNTEVQLYRYDGLPNDKTVFYSTSGDFDLDTVNGGYSFGNGTYDYAVFSSQSTALYHKANDILAVTLRYNTTDNGTDFYKDITVRNSSGTEYFVVKTGTGSSTTEEVKVGIGTTNPTSNLTVRGGDISVGVSTAHGLILTSPNGTGYRLIVGDDGTLSTTTV